MVLGGVMELHSAGQEMTIAARSVPLVGFMSLVFTRMLGERYCGQLGSLLFCLCDVFQVLINSLINSLVLTQ